MSKGAKSITFYLLMILIFGALMYLVIREGERQQIESAITAAHHAPQSLGEGFYIFWELIQQHIQSPIGILLLQIIAILLTCRLFGWLFQRIGQPIVIGEIVAGIVLGPSVLGNLLPSVSDFLFPIESLANINILSQFGLILFMFAIGMELNISEVSKKLKEAIIISHTSTVVPIFCGMLTAYFVYDTYAYKSTPFLPFALFIGIAMSISAFPVLARIIQEKGLTRTHLGTISLASAANDNISAWCLLAIVIALAQAGSMLSAFFNIFFSALYIALMFLVVRPFLKMIGHIYHNKEVINKGMIGTIFLLLIFSSYLTEMLGLHALFGAFIAGVVMPSNVKFRKIMTEKVEDVSLALFLPLFFVSTGLRTEIGLLNTPELWSMCAIFTLVAILGKFGGAMFSARFVGESWKNSLYIGALMNTRGLMELVILTIGYEMHILPPSIFVMLVLMTLVTSFMTTPLVSFIKFCFSKAEKVKEYEVVETADSSYKILLSFGRAGNGQIMLDVIYQLFAIRRHQVDITALHLTVGSDVNPLHTDNFEEVSFGPILYGAKRLGMNIETRYEISNNAGQDIVNIVNKEGFDFLLVGAGISMSNQPEDIEAYRTRTTFYNRFFRRFKAPESWFYPGSLLKDKTKMFIGESNCDVGVFVNRGFVKASNVIVVIDSEKDLFLLDYATMLLKTTHGSASILNRCSSTTPGCKTIQLAIHLFIESNEQAKVLEQKDMTAGTFNGYNFMMISYDCWNDVSEHRREALQKMPSTLILNHKNPS